MFLKPLCCRYRVQYVLTKLSIKRFQWYHLISFSRLKRMRKQYQVYKYAKNPDRRPVKKVITGTCDANATKAAITARGGPQKGDVPKSSNNTAGAPARGRGGCPRIPEDLSTENPDEGTSKYNEDRLPSPWTKPQHAPLGRSQHRQNREEPGEEMRGEEEEGWLKRTT